MKTENLRRSTIPIRHLSDVPVSIEIDIKMCQNHTKIHIYTILYKQIIFSKSATNLKSIPQEPENPRFAPIFIFILHF